jgi:hypothetical protein
MQRTSDTIDRSKPDRSRRSFIRKTGAALSAVAASAAAGFSRTSAPSSGGGGDQLGLLKRRVGNLEDAETVRRLHLAYESSLDRGRYEDVVAMFTEDAEVVYDGSRFSGSEEVRRLYCARFAAGRTGKKIEPAPGFEPDPSELEPAVEVAKDRRTASGRFPFSMQVGEPMTGDSSLVAMARLHGEGIVQWWERGSCTLACVKTDAGWKIRRLEYRTALKADYRPGRVLV